mgnify:CR=1 FL=1
MPYGPMIAFDVNTQDLNTPGAGVLVLATQIGNETIKVVTQNPSLNGDGTELKDLKGMTFAYANYGPNGEDPFEGLGSMEQVLALGAASLDISTTENGAELENEIPVLAPGMRQKHVVAWRD